MPHEGGRRDLLAGAGPASDIQERGPLSRGAHHAGIGVGADQLEHTCGGPVVERQLPGAVATHPDPNSPEQHSHAGHRLLSWRLHGHVVVGLSLKWQKDERVKCDQGKCWIRSVNG